ncbi:MAG: MFS transporter [Pseudomonadota bacterium]
MSHPSQFTLLTQRRFAPFFVTQCLGALNDNILRNGLVMLVAFSLLPGAGDNSDEFANVVAALFILPFVLFSAIAGQFADKFDKSGLVRRVKAMEIVLMLGAAVALTADSVNALIALVFAMGLQSTLFGPIKYGILPQLVSRDELVGANGLVEGGTYIAIIIGLLIGGVIASSPEYATLTLATTVIAVAVIGWFASLFIPPVAAADPELKLSYNLVRDTINVCRIAGEERSVFLSIMGLSWFWSLGLVVLAQIPAMGASVLNGTPQVANALLVCFAVGVTLGSLVCERLSRHTIELGLVPLGAIGLSVFSLDVFVMFAGGAPRAPVDVPAFLEDVANWRLLIDFTLIGASGGLFSVPLYALLQDRSRPSQRARVIAANNILNSVFMIVAAISAVGFLRAGVSVPGIFAVLAITNAVVAVYIFWLLPEFVMRFLVWILVNVLYRIEVKGADRIPREGPALLVANHVSFVDALLIGGAVTRPTRFVMYYKIFQIPLLSFIFKTARAIPIAGRKENPALMEAAFERIDEELAAGRVVCIFPEGAITHDGLMQNFRPGMERILERRPVPVVPIGLNNLWGSWFSREGGGALRKWPRRFRARITVAIGVPIAAAEATAETAQSAVAALLESGDGD